MLVDIHPTHPEPRKIKAAVDALRAGEVIVCPTDTVHAFVCSAESARAVEELARLKGGKRGKAELSLICESLSHLSDYARVTETAAYRIVKRALPGPFTFILPASTAIPKLFKNNRKTIGIRVPDHAVPQAIVKELGHALAATSVHDPDTLLDHTSEAWRIEELFGHQLAMVLDAGPCGLEPSTVIDLSQSEPLVVRQGKGDPSAVL
ncbi:MAG: threonylcarbamoyl-AMP synthase [Flavobacteriales bacterium]|nr:threonylcarbamoyl-AMP synthase [Flavobacteriales bacterium]